MAAIVISGFTGVGKSVSSSTGERFLDSDSINFSWLKDKDGKIELDKYGKNKRNPNFPNNYIEHIKSNLNKADIIFISSHAVVREALNEANIPFILAYPE